MVRFKIKAEAGLLKAVANTLSTIVDECRLKFEKGRLTIKAVDPAHVSMITIDLDSKLFEEYTIRDGQTGEVGIDLDQLKDILRELDDSTLVKLQYDSDNDKYIRYWHDFFDGKLKPVDIEGMSKPKLPNLNLPGYFEMEYSRMLQILRTLSGVSDIYVFKFSCGEGVKISTYSEDDVKNAWLSKDLLTDMEWPKNVKKGEEYISIFPEDYLRALFDRNGRGMSGFFEGDNPRLDSVWFKMGHDYPLIIGADSIGITIRYTLAPRIPSE